MMLLDEDIGYGALVGDFLQCILKSGSVVCVKSRVVSYMIFKVRKNIRISLFWPFLFLKRGWKSKRSDVETERSARTDLVQLNDEEFRILRA